MERILVYTMGRKFSADEMQGMENIINNFLKEHNIILEVPVDIFSVATKLGFDVRGAEFEDNLDGLIVVDENEDVIEPFTSNKIIAYNCKRDITSKKFIVAHELSHYIEEKVDNPRKKIVCAARDHADNYSQDDQEQRKDYMAAALLMPKEHMLGRYTNISKTSDFITQVANDYNVREIMAERRIAEVFNG